MALVKWVAKYHERVIADSSSPSGSSSFMGPAPAFSAKAPCGHIGTIDEATTSDTPDQAGEER